MTAGAPRVDPRSTQLAAVLQGPRIARFERSAVPDPGPGQVVVRLEGSGICGSDVPVWTGEAGVRYPLGPGAPGHEGWGTIAAAASDVAGLEPGRRVALLGGHAYARYEVVDAAVTVPLPEELRGPFPGEAVACAMNVARRAGIEPGSTVAIVGVGFLGALLVQLASAAGARVLAVSRRGFALELARACGAGVAVPLDADAVGDVGRTTSGTMCDVVIEAAGRQRTLDVASELVRTRGRLVVAGYHQDGSRTVDMRSWNWRGIDVINAHERDLSLVADGIRRGVEAVLQGRIDLAPLITHEFPLEELPRAFDTAVERPDGFVKAVVRT